MAREKQIPREPNDRVHVEPVIDENGAYVDGKIFVNWFCPTCGTCVGTDDIRDKFCSECGQAITQEVSNDCGYKN